MINKVDICGVNTSKLPVLSEAQKRKLFEKIQSGDVAARQEFIYGNLRLVLSVLQRFSNRNENIDDLFQVGCIGLIKALDNFDTSHGVKFSTYAVPMNVLWGKGVLFKSVVYFCSIVCNNYLRHTAFNYTSSFCPGHIFPRLTQGRKPLFYCAVLF